MVRLRDREAWRDLKMLVMQRDRYCVAEKLWPERACRGPMDYHHVWSRGRGGPALDPANVILLCRAHHDAVHDDQWAAERRGLLAAPWTGDAGVVAAAERRIKILKEMEPWALRQH